MTRSRASAIAAAWIARLVSSVAGRNTSDSEQLAKRAAAEDARYGEPEVVEDGGQTIVRLYGDVIPHAYAPWYLPGEAVSDVGFVKAMDRIPKGAKVLVQINSLGGDVFGGTVIANTVAARGADTHVTGIAASIASVILAAGKKASIGRGATVMVHKPWSYAGGNAVAMRAEADVLDTIESAMVDIYVGKSGKKYTRAQWLAALAGPDGADGSWWTGAQAVEAGVADSYEQPAEDEPAPRTAELLTQRKAVAALYCSKLPKHLDEAPASVESESPTAPTSGESEAKPGKRTSAQLPGVSYLR